MEMCRALLLSDTPAHLLTWEGAFPTSGCRAVSARSTHEALELLGHHEFAFVLIDLHASLRSGIEAAREIRRREDSGVWRTPVVFVHAAGDALDPELVREGGQLGSTDFQPMPFDVETLRFKASVYASFHQSKRQALRDRIAEVSDSPAFLDSLIENLPNMVFVKDARELRFVRLNRAGEELLGYSRSELIGKNDYDFFPKDQADFFISKDRAVLAGHQIVDIPEEAIHTQVRGERVLHTRKIPIFDADGKPEFLLGISEDITEAKIAEQRRLELIREQTAFEEAQKAIQARDDFLSVASHELKTPITSLKLQLQLTRRNINLAAGTQPSPKMLAKALDVSDVQINRITALVDDFLDVSRIQSGKLTYHFERTDLSELVREMADRFGDHLRAAQCELSVHAENPVYVDCDRFRIEQVLVNLLSNAAKYASGKPVKAEVAQIKDQVCIIIRDQGMGIPPQKIDKIFERFERAVTSSNISGLGLGLYITREIVKAHRGSIRVESELGKGSTFVVSLPSS